MRRATVCDINALRTQTRTSGKSCRVGVVEQNVQFLFGDYKLDVDRRELRQGPALISIGPQGFDLLVYLLSNRERVVSKDDLVEGVWDGRAVSDSTLASQLNAVRKAIGDSGEEQKLIRTVSRRGFRFIGQVTGEQSTGAASMVQAVKSPGPEATSDGSVLS